MELLTSVVEVINLIFFSVSIACATVTAITFLVLGGTKR